MAVRDQLRRNEAVWRYLLTDATRESLSSTRAVLGDFLDGLACASGDAGEYFKTVTDTWLSERESSNAFDWRYYLVKYPSMRAARRASTTASTGSSATPCACSAPQRLNGYYRDPILLEVWRSSGVGERVQDPWFIGYETNPRWLRLERSGVGMRSISDGFALQGPEDESPPINVHRHLQPDTKPWTSQTKASCSRSLSTTTVTAPSIRPTALSSARPSSVT